MGVALNKYVSSYYCSAAVLLSIYFLLFGKDFLQISTFVSPLRGSGLGGFHPQVPLRSTWGYSWCRPSGAQAVDGNPPYGL